MTKTWFSTKFGILLISLLFVLLIAALSLTVLADSCTISQDACKVTCKDSLIGSITRHMKVHNNLDWDAADWYYCTASTASAYSSNNYFKQSLDINTNGIHITSQKNSDDDMYVRGVVDFKDLPAADAKLSMRMYGSVIKMKYDFKIVPACPGYKLDFTSDCSDDGGDRTDCYCTITENYVAKPTITD